MKRRTVIKASTDVKEFNVYFVDRNIKILEGDNIYDVLSYVLFELGYDAKDIWKIEER